MSAKRIASYSPPSSHHIAKRPKTSILSQDQLGLLISTMNSEAEEGNWSSRLQRDRNLLIVLYEVLLAASTGLQSTTLEDRIVTPKEIPAPAALDATLTNEEKAGWKSFLEEVLKTKDWEKLITPPILQVQLVSLRTQALDIATNERSATIMAWKTTFVGETHRLLHSVIDDMNTARNRTEGLYSNFLPIVQSSGTGKSRTVDELSKFVFTLPFNLRDPREVSGFPAPDLSVRNFFSSNMIYGERDTYESLRTRFVVFIGWLFEVVRKELQTLSPCSSHEEFATLWHNLLLQPNFRSELYLKATDIPAELKTQYSAKDIESRPGVHTAATNFARENAVNLFRDIHRLSGQTYAGQRLHTRPVQLLLYFDESHDMTKDFVQSDLQKEANTPLPTKQEEEYAFVHTAYQSLCSAFNTLLEFDCFVIFLSTNSSLARYSPSQKRLWSSRSRDAAVDSLQAPFVELPFDTWSNPILVTEGAHTLEEVCTTDFMVRFGRPLWWTRWAVGDDETKGDVISFAIRKLTGVSVGERSDDGDLAALSLRLLLEFEPRREISVNAENRLVEGHMRIAYSVPKHREYLRSGAPSEPILAEAAARVMESIVSIPNALLKMVQDGLISKGERGELVARLLLILAHDRAARNASTNISSDSSPLLSEPHPTLTHRVLYGVPILLVDFLRELVGEDQVQEILKSTPQNIPNGVTFEEAFQGARIHFTHFVKATDASVVSDEAAWIAMSRGMAWQCFNQQAMIDILIPILLWNDKLNRWSMTAIFIQIKNSRRHQAVHIDAERLRFFTTGNEKANSRPYTTLTLEFGVQNIQTPSAPSKPNDARSTTPPHYSKETAAAATSPSKLNILPPRSAASPRATKRTPTHPRYAINIIGCSSTVFAVIGSNEKNTFAALLASRSLLDEHPRNTRDCLRAVVRLKPYWAEGIDSFHWISPDLSSDATIRGRIPVEESLHVKDSIDIIDENVTAESYDADASMDVDDYEW